MKLLLVRRVSKVGKCWDTRGSLMKTNLYGWQTNFGSSETIEHPMGIKETPRKSCIPNGEYRLISVNNHMSYQNIQREWDISEIEEDFRKYGIPYLMKKGVKRHSRKGWINVGDMKQRTFAIIPAMTTLFLEPGDIGIDSRFCVNKIPTDYIKLLKAIYFRWKAEKKVYMRITDDKIQSLN